MPELSLISNVLIVLFSAFLGGLISRKFKQPIIFGYLLAGLVVSCLTTNLGLKRENLSFLAEIGLALLMFTLGLEHYLILSAVLFCIGLFGVLTQRNVIKVIMCLEIMLNAVNITLIAFSQYITPTALTGQIFALFVMVVAAAEVAVGIAIIFSIYRNRETVDIENFNILRW